MNNTFNDNERGVFIKFIKSIFLRGGCFNNHIKWLI